MQSDNLRPISFRLSAEPREAKGFRFTEWRITDLAPHPEGPETLWLQLGMTERAAYRFNLSSGTPRLFVRAGFAGGPVEPTAITASQEVAAAWMDGEQQVLEADMPLTIQMWLEAYLARHGEAPVEGRKKQREGPGRAREDLA